MSRAIYWAPRLVGIAAIIFISLFALDVFDPAKTSAEVASALFVHLIPSYVLAAALAFAWRFELWGGLAFLIVAALPFWLLNNPGWVNAVLAGPFALTGLLFLVDHFHRTRMS